MKTQGREHANWGFKVPEPGWHDYEIMEGLDQNIIENSGKTSIMIRAKVTEGSEDDGAQVTIFVPYKDEKGDVNAFGEQKLADVLAAAKLSEEFEKHYPGERSVFEEEIMGKIKTKLPGRFMSMRTENATGKDNRTNVNVVEVAVLGAANVVKGPVPTKTSSSTSKEKADTGTSPAHRENW
jgi:hypothetical protein